MMSTFITSSRRLRLWQVALAAGALLCVALPAHAQTDRERQQMLQLQQQLQKLRQENAQLQQGKAAEIEKARAEGERCVPTPTA